MKKTTLLMISMLLTSAVFCQFTMNSSYNLVPGENYRMDMYNEITSMNPGPSGSNVSWDFSTISGGTYIAGEPSFCIDPAGTPYVDSTSLVGSNLCIRGEGTSDEGPFVYYAMTNSNQSMLGLGNTVGGAVSFANYDDPLIGIEFPCSYGTNISDTYKYRLYNSTAGMYMMKDSGYVMMTVDAWGSITTPEAHYDNVIRLVTTTTSYMYMNFGAGWVHTGTNVDIHYSWMAENLKINVFSITEFVTAGGYSVTYLVDHNFPLGIDEAEKIAFDIYPNPATSIIHFQCGEAIQQYRVYCINGRLIEDGNLSVGSREYYLPVSHYPPGTYILEALFEQGSVARKCFVKR